MRPLVCGIPVERTPAGGALDLIVQRLVDAMMAVPGLIIVLAIMAVLGSSLNNVIIAIVMGRQLAQNAATHLLGLGVMWSGIVAVALLDLWTLFRVVRR